jgi:hypothetical protein
MLRAPAARTTGERTPNQPALVSRYHRAHHPWPRLPPLTRIGLVVRYRRPVPLDGGQLGIGQQQVT